MVQRERPDHERTGAGSQDASALDLAANQTKLLEAIREMMIPSTSSRPENAQAYGAKARLIQRDWISIPKNGRWMTMPDPTSKMLCGHSRISPAIRSWITS